MKDARCQAPPASDSRTIVTELRLAAAPGRVWEGLLFFEQITLRPPALLAMLLPVPLGSEGGRSSVGDTIRCVYRTGYLVKRITVAEPQRRLAFDVVEQELAVGGGIRLESGSYRLSELSGGYTSVEIETRYRRPGWLRALWRPVEAAVGHAFHHHLLAALRRQVEPAPRIRAPWTRRHSGSWW